MHFNKRNRSRTYEIRISNPVQSPCCSSLKKLIKTGFEPMKLTQRIYNPPLLAAQAPDLNLPEAKGIEPLPPVLKTSALPLNYASLCDLYESRTRNRQILSLTHLPLC